MKTVALKLLLLLAPPMAVVYGFPFLILAGSGELHSVNRIVNYQARGDRPVLYGPAYSNPAKVLKLRAVLHRRPEVVVLGTSRVMQIRARMFRDPSTFYNAGGAIATIWELREFLDRLPRGYEPKLMVVGLDQNLFNRNFAEFRNATPLVDPAWNEIVHNSRATVFQDYRAGKFTLGTLFARRGSIAPFGLNAMANGNGFRNDGSYRYGSIIASPDNPANDDFNFKDTFARISAGDRRFEYGQRASRQAIDELQRFLVASRRRNIQIVGVLPPYAHVVYVRMMEMGDKYGYMKELRDILQPLFDAERFPLFDFSDLASAGASDEETIDGFHASERAYARMILQLQQSDSVAARYAADAEALRTRIEASGPHVVFGDEEF